MEILTNISDTNEFGAIFSGQIDKVEGDFGKDLYCRYSIVAGIDWIKINGDTEGISQVSNQAIREFSTKLPSQSIYSFGLPISTTYKATNLFGWPRLVFGLYGRDWLNRDIAKGYGSVLLPVMPGKHSLSVSVFRPVVGSPFERFLRWVAGAPPEFKSLAFLAGTDGRNAVSSVSEGKLTLTVHSTLFPPPGSSSSISTGIGGPIGGKTGRSRGLGSLKHTLSSLSPKKGKDPAISAIHEHAKQLTQSFLHRKPLSSEEKDTKVSPRISHKSKEGKEAPSSTTKTERGGHRRESSFKVDQLKQSTSTEDGGRERESSRQPPSLEKTILTRDSSRVQDMSMLSVSKLSDEAKEIPKRKPKQRSGPSLAPLSTKTILNLKNAFRPKRRESSRSRDESEKET
ncbi:B9-type C2 domain like protein [Aduncisulcus paluster]|uniref:B9 domain-containing protein 1 n=1 Tax=Aduncisulcus paluster TaxID=2918883 RepID=A0ABQ5KPL4_9EUKA|nr:B9-type C2 domain like protein [Aduncisulcus paluster]